LDKIKATLQEDREKMFNDKYLNNIKDKIKVKIVKDLVGRDSDSGGWRS